MTRDVEERGGFRKPVVLTRIPHLMQYTVCPRARCACSKDQRIGLYIPLTPHRQPLLSNQKRRFGLSASFMKWNEMAVQALTPFLRDSATASQTVAHSACTEAVRRKSFLRTSRGRCCGQGCRLKCSQAPSRCLEFLFYYCLDRTLPHNCHRRTIKHRINTFLTSMSIPPPHTHSFFPSTRKLTRLEERQNFQGFKLILLSRSPVPCSALRQNLTSLAYLLQMDDLFDDEEEEVEAPAPKEESRAEKMAAMKAAKDAKKKVDRQEEIVLLKKNQTLGTSFEF